MFASSSGASTSSRMQYGLGFARNNAINRATAVIAFSPPESSERFRGSFPGGARDDVDAGVQNVLGIGLQNQVGRAAAEALAEQFLEVPANGLERLREPPATSRR